MAQINVADYIEGNKTAVYSTTAKNIAPVVFSGDMFGGGQVTGNIERQNSAGVFVGIDGHMN